LAYVGNSPALKYASFAVQHFTTSATTSYSLDHAVANENDIRLVINNVIQQPGSGKAYTASATTLTLSAATAGTDTMYCVFLGKAVQTVVPPAGSVTGSTLADDVISAQSALGAAPADTDEFLVSDSGTLKRVDYSYVKSTVVNRPNAQPIIINGNMDVWQRGTATVTTTGDYVGVDRFKISEDTDGSFSTERHTMSNAEFTTTGFGYALQADCTGTDASIGASQTAEITQKIEAQNLQLLQYGTSNAKNLTLSFWVKSSKTGTYCVAIRKRDTTSYDIPIEYSISSADTWEKKVLNISPTAGSTSFITSAAGAITNDNGDGLHVTFCLAIGSNFQGTNNTWVAASKLCTSNQVNWMDSTSNDFYLTGVQLEVGEYTSATIPPFQHETYAENLIRCMRYFQTPIFNKDTQGTNEEYAVFGTGVYSSSSYFRCPRPLPVEMRINPSLVSSSGTNYFFILAGANDDINDLAIFPDSNYKTAWVYNSDEASGTAGQAGILMGNNASAYAWLNAEL